MFEENPTTHQVAADEDLPCDLATWRRRAIEAESKLRTYDPQVVELGERAMQALIAEPKPKALVLTKCRLCDQLQADLTARDERIDTLIDGLTRITKAARLGTEPFAIACEILGELDVLLIQEAAVVRDENGMFRHPDLPGFEEGDGEKYKAWIAEQRLEVVMVELETDAAEEIADRYFESCDPDCSYWEPTRPDGEGWFCLAIHDSDDGPVCWWGRRVVTS